MCRDAQTVQDDYFCGLELKVRVIVWVMVFVMVMVVVHSTCTLLGSMPLFSTSLGFLSSRLVADAQLLRDHLLLPYQFYSSY